MHYAMHKASQIVCMIMTHDSWDMLDNWRGDARLRASLPDST